MRHTSRYLLLALLLTVTALNLQAANPERDDPRYKPDEKQVAKRVEQIEKTAPENAKLCAYLDCGRQWSTGDDATVAIELPQGKPYLYAPGLEIEGVEPTQTYVAFDTGQLTFILSDIDRTKKYVAGLTWWDFDNGGRSQGVWAKSGNGHMVRPAIHPTRLPAYEGAKQLPGEKQFKLPATLATDGKLQLTLQCVTGSNCVISELWIWEIEE